MKRVCLSSLPFLLLGFFHFSCLPPSVVTQPENIQRAYYHVNKTDGISQNEAISIARYHMWTHEDPERGRLRGQFDLYKIWNLERDADGIGGEKTGYRLGFRPPSDRDDLPVPNIEWRVYVDDQTGEVVNSFPKILADSD